MSATIKSTPKSGKKSKIVVLHMSARALFDFRQANRHTVPSVDGDRFPSIQPPELADKSSEANSTPVPASSHDVDNNSLAPPKPTTGRKRGGASLTGRKRAPPSIDPNAPPRERGRPGPKKKPRLPDGTIDRTGERGVINGNPVPAHKLGPKANTGAINAGLRALDRSGTPCRRWGKRPLQLKSFTGTQWAMPSWKAPLHNAGFPGDVKSDSTGSSEAKAVNNASSAVPSERSHSHIDGDTTMINGIVESSPAPAIAA